MKEETENKDNIRKAEDYISNMLGTMMSVSAVLATVSVGVLAIIIRKGPVSTTQVLPTFLILISVVLFILSFWQGMRSHGTLILAVKSGKDGFEKARLPTLRSQRTMLVALIILGSACALVLYDMLQPLLSSSSTATKTAVIHQYRHKILESLVAIFIIIGSIGMICFASKFPLSGRISDLALASERLLGLHGHLVWIWSWVFILLGSSIQLGLIWFT